MDLTMMLDMMGRLKTSLGDGHELAGELDGAMATLGEVQTAMATLGELQEQHATVMAERDELAGKHEATAAERDAMMAERDGLMAKAEAASSEASEKWSAAVSREAALTAKYLGAVRAANPDLPEELVVGETLEAIDAAVEQAKTIVSKVKERVSAELAARTVPNGAPARGSGLDMESMSPKEKIAMGLRRS